MDLAEALFSPLAYAEDLVSRLDERVRACPFAAGWTARLEFLEAVAWGWNSGQVVTNEELLLHDESMDRQMPGTALLAAHGLVRARRKAVAGGPELLSPAGAAWLAGRRTRPPAARAGGHAAADRPLDPEAPLAPQLLGEVERLQAGTTTEADQAVAEWLSLLSLADPRLPALLQAAVALEGWRIIDPYPRETWLGPLMVAQWLRTRRRVRSHLISLELGLRELSRSRRPAAAAPLAERLVFWVEVTGQGAATSLEQLNRLELARQVAVARIGERRAHSHLNALLDLLLERPVVSAPAAASRLQVSGQTARRLFAELGASVTEVSGQTRYRAWRL
jgi:hypothetical protein